jgi:hypothetical protein
VITPVPPRAAASEYLIGSPQQPPLCCYLRMKLEQLMQPFAAAIEAKITFIKDFGPALTDKQHRRLLESVSDDIRKATDLHPPRVSVAAKGEAARRQINLTEKGWHDQRAFDPGRQVFYLEHMNPVASLRDACMDGQSPLDVLVRGTRVVWILRDESRRLAARRASPDEAYRAAGIEIAQD